MTNQMAKIEQTQMSKSKYLNAKTIPVCPLNLGLDLTFELCNLTLFRIQAMGLPRSRLPSPGGQVARNDKKVRRSQ
jgi:hypothetical protein